MSLTQLHVRRNFQNIDRKQIKTLELWRVELCRSADPIWITLRGMFLVKTYSFIALQVTTKSRHYMVNGCNN